MKNLLPIRRVKNAVQPYKASDIMSTRSASSSIIPLILTIIPRENSLTRRRILYIDIWFHVEHISYRNGLRFYVPYTYIDILPQNSALSIIFHAYRDCFRHSQ